jgi:nitrogenase molybdenum-iron protein alpha/beta subunit
MGCDIDLVYSTLRRRFPDIKIADCYMDVIRKKTGHTAEQMVRRGIYNMLDKCPGSGSVNIIGNNLPTDQTSRLCRIVTQAGYKLMELPLCRSFEEFLAMGGSELNIITQPVSEYAAQILQQRLGTPYIYMPNTFSYDKLTNALDKLAAQLGICPPDTKDDALECERELKRLKELLGDTPIAIDHNFTPLFLSLTRMLIEHGFNVRRIYADSFLPEEAEDFNWLVKNAGDIKLYATIQPQMRAVDRSTDRTYLALGQKAAFFTDSEHFVNVVEGGGMYGFEGIMGLCRLMRQAYNEKKDVHIIQRKGLGGVCRL